MAADDLHDADLTDAPLERRALERRRRDVPVPVDRRRTDRRASRLSPELRFAGVAIVVDTWPLMRAGIGQLLAARGFRVAADTSTVDEAAPAIGDRCDLAVLGVTAHETVDAVRRVQRLPGGEHDGPQVVLLMERVEIGELRKLLAMGVQGVVGRSIGMDDLGAACERVMAGQRVLSGGPLSVLASAGLEVAGGVAGEGEAEAPVQVLTRKELEVLGHLARHRSNREIAEHLHVSAATVKTHLQNIYGKLDVSSRREAVVAGVERGLLT